MKAQKRIFSMLMALMVSWFTSAAPLHNETTTFKVYGNCEMCKKRIETALKKNPAIKSAEWNVKTKMVKVVYDPHMISVDQMHKIIAEAGHDTEKVKANDATYKSLPVCCQYTRAVNDNSH